MVSSENSSASSLFTNSDIQAPLCHCSQPTERAISWTDENPGRRFFKCEEHGFIVWIDKAKLYLWQKRSLLEAREQNRRQEYEIKALREAVGKANAQLAVLDLSRSTSSDVHLLNAIEALLTQQKIETEKKLRRFVLTSWGGLVVATAVLVYVLKN